MSRYANYPELDDAPGQDGDRAFTGVVSKIDAALLDPGMVAEAVNLVMRSGMAETRPGTVTPAALNAVDFGAILGSGIFSDPDTGEEWILIASAGGVWKTRDGSWPQPVSLGTETLGGPVEFVQAFDRVLLLRGEDAAPMVWTGDAEDGFEVVDQTPLGDGSSPMPNAAWGIVAGNRLIVPVGRDRVAISDLLDYTRYDAVLNELRINAGTRDEITALVADQSRQAILVFRWRSIFLLSNFYGDLSALRVDVLNEGLGCIARLSAVRVGAEIFFLSSRGVYTISEVIQERLAASEVPLSDAIEPLMRRINWPYASAACAALWQEYYWLAVPLDGSEVNNVVLRFNTVTKRWEGYDAWDEAAGVQIDRFVIADYQGRAALHGIDDAHERILVFGEGFSDLIDGEEYEIATRLLTRGYGNAAPGIKRVRNVAVDVQTWAAQFSIAARVDGVEEVEPLAANRAPARTRWHDFGRGLYDEANPADNHGAPMRQDYSIALAADAEFDPHDGEIDPELKQITKERFALRRSRGAWVQLDITNTRGFLRVRGIDLEGAETERNTRSRA